MWYRERMTPHLPGMHGTKAALCIIHNLGKNTKYEKQTVPCNLRDKLGVSYCLHLTPVDPRLSSVPGIQNRLFEAVDSILYPTI